MSRGAQTFKQADILKLIRAAMKAGFASPRVEIDKKTGNMILVTAGDDPPPEGDEWDRI
jgi:hypothetical protein